MIWDLSSGLSLLQAFLLEAGCYADRQPRQLCGEARTENGLPTSWALSPALAWGVSRLEPTASIHTVTFMGDEYFIFSVIKQQQQRKSDRDGCGLLTIYCLFLRTQQMCQPWLWVTTAAQCPKLHPVKNCGVDPQSCGHYPSLFYPPEFGGSALCRNLTSNPLVVVSYCSLSARPYLSNEY